MKLKVLTPTQVVCDEDVTKVTAEAQNGSFCLEPRHVDFVSALAPGLLSFESPDGREEFFAVDEGILIKFGPEVLVSTGNAIRGPDLGRLQETVQHQFKALDEKDRQTRSAMAKLEANFVRAFMELKEGPQ